MLIEQGEDVQLHAERQRLGDGERAVIGCRCRAPVVAIARTRRDPPRGRAAGLDLAR
jgi:hypothetical protein